jgi:hypothetical protein
MAMAWFLPVIVGCLIWAYLSVTLNRHKIDEFNRKARKAGRLRSRLMHSTFKG